MASLCTRQHFVMLWPYAMVGYIRTRRRLVDSKWYGTASVWCVLIFFLQQVLGSARETVNRLLLSAFTAAGVPPVVVLLTVSCTEQLVFGVPVSLVFLWQVFGSARPAKPTHFSSCFSFFHLQVLVPAPKLSPGLYIHIDRPF